LQNFSVLICDLKNHNDMMSYSISLMFSQF